MENKKIIISEDEINRIHKLDDIVIDDHVLATYTLGKDHVELTRYKDLFDIPQAKKQQVGIIVGMENIEPETSMLLKIPSLLDPDEFRELPRSAVKLSGIGMQFQLMISNDQLVVTHDDFEVYREPLYHQLEIFCDDQDDEDGEDDDWIESFQEEVDAVKKDNMTLFDDRVQTIMSALKKKYGQYINIKPRGGIDYPTTLFIVPMSRYIQKKQLPKVENQWQHIKVILMSYGCELYPEFIRHLSTAVDYEILMKKLGQLYVEYCGISLGYRTVIHAQMQSIVERLFPQADWDEVCQKVEAVLDGIDLVHKKYDVGVLPEDLSLQLQLYVELVQADPQSAHYFSHGLYVAALTGDDFF